MIHNITLSNLASYNYFYFFLSKAGDSNPTNEEKMYY